MQHIQDANPFTMTGRRFIAEMNSYCEAGRALEVYERMIRLRDFPRARQAALLAAAHYRNAGYGDSAALMQRQADLACRGLFR